MCQCEPKIKAAPCGQSDCRLSNADRRKAIIPEDQAFLGIILEVVAQNAEAMNLLTAEVAALRAEVAKLQQSPRGALGGLSFQPQVHHGITGGITITGQNTVLGGATGGGSMLHIGNGSTIDSRCVTNSYQSPHSAPNMKELLDELTGLVDLGKSSS